MAEAIELKDNNTADFLIRTQNRTATLGQSTMALVAHFVGLGDTNIQARAKVKQLSHEISAAKPGAKFDYTLGDTQELVDCVNASVLVFMNAAAKKVVTDILNQQ